MLTYLVVAIAVLTTLTLIGVVAILACLFWIARLIAVNGGDTPPQ